MAIACQVAWSFCNHERSLTRSAASRCGGFRVAERVALAWQADDLSVTYSYPGLTAALQPAPFTPNVAAIKVAVEKLIGVTFNSCHLNLYRCGADHVSWHTDEDCDLCVRLGFHRAGSSAP
mgnify:CR=1 FL=1